MGGGGGGSATITTCTNPSPEYDHGRDGRFLTKILAELKKVIQMFYLRPLVQNFA